MHNSLMMKNTAIMQSETLPNKNSIGELASRFVMYLDVSAVSVKSYKSGIKKFLTFLHENCINNPTRDTVILYKKTLCDKYSASTVSLYLSSLRRFFTWCESENLYCDITRGVKSPRIDSGHKKDSFTANQLREIIGGINRNSLKGLRDYALMCLISATGLRTVEAMRADISDIRNVGGADCLFVQGKGRSSKSEFVKLSVHVMKAIRAYLDARGEVSQETPLFASLSHRNTGERMTTRSISRICKTAMISAGYISKRWTAHSLRHSAVTLALMAGISLQEVSQFARHSSISVTMVYAHDVQRLKSRCESAISAAIFGD